MRVQRASKTRQPASTHVRQPAVQPGYMVDRLVRKHGLHSFYTAWRLLLRESAMPWLETDLMTERLKFVQDALSDRFTMAEVCARHGVSRPTGYKWIARYAEEGRRRLGDRSRAPHTCPHKLSPSMTELLCTTREAHPFWGARKLLVVLQAKHPRIREWPAPSTVADLLARRGLVQRRRTRRASCQPSPTRQMICGRPTSKASSARAMPRTVSRCRCESPAADRTRETRAQRLAWPARISSSAVRGT